MIVNNRCFCRAVLKGTVWPKLSSFSRIYHHQCHFLTLLFAMQEIQILGKETKKGGEWQWQHSGGFAWLCCCRHQRQFAERFPAKKGGRRTNERTNARLRHRLRPILLCDSGIGKHFSLLLDDEYQP